MYEYFFRNLFKMRIVQCYRNTQSEFESSTATETLFRSSAKDLDWNLRIAVKTTSENPFLGKKQNIFQIFSRLKTHFWAKNKIFFKYFLDRNPFLGKKQNIFQIFLD